ncbi:MAG TPA: PHP-associated domain-containing protein [Vicinamibacterales bacterium]|nr:PHP-associated domain-containing protein [Vicinamibacterales bacterium]
MKVDFHTHTADDPLDSIPYSAAQLVDRAAALGYGALAITLHERQLDVSPLASYAADRGVVLIPGIEQTIEGKHVLLVNFRRGAERVNTFADLARLKASEPGLVIAPHAFYPASTCLRGLLDRHADLIDAVECNAMFTASLDFNARAAAWARAHGKPLVGNGDVHRLRQLGTTWSEVDAPPDADAICAAVKAGRVRVHATPLAWREAAGIMVDLLAWRTTAGRRIETMTASGSTNISLPQSA